MTPTQGTIPTPTHVGVPLPPVDYAFAATGKYMDTGRLAAHAEFTALAKQGAASGVVFLGDSLTFFWGSSHNPTADGIKDWNANFQPLGAANFGVYGDRTENLLWRIENGELAGQPKVVVLMIGINDLTAGRTPAQTARNIGTVVQVIRAESPSTKILLEGLLPTGFSKLSAQRAQVNGIIASLAGMPNVSYLDPGAKMADASGNILRPLTADGLHLSAAGYDVLLSTLIGTLHAALGR